MRATQSPFDNDNIEPRLPGRRAWVKSAVLTAASAMAVSSRARSERLLSPHWAHPISHRTNPLPLFETKWWDSCLLTSNFPSRN
jgi:hypothetical protein